MIPSSSISAAISNSSLSSFDLTCGNHLRVSCGDRRRAHHQGGQVKAANKHRTIVSYDLNYRPSLWKTIGGLKMAQEVNREIANTSMS